MTSRKRTLKAGQFDSNLDIHYSINILVVGNRILVIKVDVSQSHLSTSCMITTEMMIGLAILTTKADMQVVTIIVHSLLTLETLAAGQLVTRPQFEWSPTLSALVQV